MKDRYDIAIIGAGPAGMAAADTLQQSDLKVCLLDEQPAAGGQIYRSIDRQDHMDPSILGADYYAGRDLCENFKASSVRHLPNAKVWEVTPDGLISYTRDGQARQIQAERILLATGAQERPMPFPGWTLPGIMTCGAAQIALKSSGQVPSEPVVIAGSGPLIFLIASQLLKAGCEIRAILDTTPSGRLIGAAKHVPGALRGWRYLAKGLGMLRQIRGAGIPIIKNVQGLRARGDAGGMLEGLEYLAQGKQHGMDTKILLVHQGVIPNLQMTRALDCEHVWDPQARNWVVQCDETGRSSHPRIFVAGDGRFIMGAKASEYAGRMAAYGMMQDLNYANAGQNQGGFNAARKAFQCHLAIRPFLDHLYAPAPGFVTPPDDTMICRCEEVTAGEIRNYARMGCLGPNQAKAFGRSGMGPCQGRQCGMAVSALIADERKVSPDEVGYYNIRFPIKPVTLGEVASLSEGD